MKTAILFDLDGTLLNTLEDLTDATNAALAMFGYPPRTTEEVRRFVGNGAWHQIRMAVPETADDTAAEQVLAAYKPYYNSHCTAKTRPYDGIPAALEELKREFVPAIVSNKPDPTAKALCARWFPGITARGEAADCPRKPAPDMVRKTLAGLGADRCIYVGDSEVDVATAKNAGVPCLSVLWGFRTRQELVQAGATRFCPSPEQLPDMLRALASTL